jgi:hypothetical protein
LRPRRRGRGTRGTTCQSGLLGPLPVDSASRSDVRAVPGVSAA